MKEGRRWREGRRRRRKLDRQIEEGEGKTGDLAGGRQADYLTRRVTVRGTLHITHRCLEGDGGGPKLEHQAATPVRSTRWTSGHHQRLHDHATYHFSGPNDPNSPAASHPSRREATPYCSSHRHQPSSIERLIPEASSHDEYVLPDRLCDLAG
nr:hypothetical protein CFP56_20948 [Quercus suber]